MKIEFPLPIRLLHIIFTIVAASAVSGWNVVEAQNYSSSLGTQVAPQSSQTHGRFGSSVAINSSKGSRFYFGEPGRINPNAPGGAAQTGAIHIGRRSGNSWVLDANPIFPSDGGNGDQFGYSLAADGYNRLLIGAPGNDGAGAVYIIGDYNTGDRAIKLVAPQRIPGENFGISVASSYPSAVVGAPGNAASTGKVYIFDECTFTISAPDGSPGDFFGQSVAILHNGTVVVGAYGDDDAGNDAGSVYVFPFSYEPGGGFAFAQKIVPSDGLPGNSFGFSMAASGDTLVVGAPFGGAGAAYIYHYDGSAFQFEAKILPSDGQAQLEFGSSVAINGSEILVGAPHWTDLKYGTVEGRAYYFQKSNGIWSERSILKPVTHSKQGSLFGAGVALDGKIALVGAPGEECLDMTDCGKGYTFSKSCTLNEQCNDESPCSADICQNNICTYNPLGSPNDPYPSIIRCSDDQDTTGGIERCIEGNCVGAFATSSCPARPACNRTCVTRGRCLYLYKPSSTLCRAATGSCDSPEYCTGSSFDCPIDSFKPSTTICREASGTCDMPEYCSGEAAMCPLDAFRLSGSSCNDGLYCNGNDSCDGSGACLHSGNPCSGPDGDRDCSESCDEALDSCSAHDPDISMCSDGIIETVGDYCAAGICISGVNNSCKKRGKTCSADWQCCSLNCNLKTKKCRGLSTLRNSKHR